MAIEEPKYKIASKNMNFEIREYTEILVAETEVEGPFSQAGSSGFRLLADYIFGNNQSKTKMEMNAPVSQAPSEKIEMTAPVTLTAKNDKYLIQFTLPAIYRLETAPIPNDGRVKIKALSQRKMAVHTYSGSWSEETYSKELSIFRRALLDAGLKTTGEPIFARFNSPFSLWFLRRNEIWFELDSSIATP